MNATVDPTFWQHAELLPKASPVFQIRWPSDDERRALNLIYHLARPTACCSIHAMLHAAQALELMTPMTKERFDGA